MDKKRILIIDDEENMRHAIRRLLEPDGTYEIAEAGDGLEAEKRIKDFSPDLVILDIKMPGKFGYEICMNIKENPQMSHIKVVGISGISGGIGNAMMSTLGADSYFEKPFDNDKFKNKITSLLK